MTELPPLSALRAFEAAARHMSFTRAADDLGMTQAAVSYQIKLLEEKLGFPLFMRKPRKIELTAKGHQLSGRLICAFSDLRNAVDSVREQSESVLTISCNTTFAMQWLAARLSSFEQRHPKLMVRIVPYDTSEVPQFLDSDIAVTACHPAPNDWVQHDIVSVHFTPMLSPALLKDKPALKTPADLLSLPLIGPHDPWWALWFAEAGMPDTDLSHLTSSRMGSQALEGNRALAGQGVGILTPFFYRQHLDAGLLIQPFEQVTEITEQSWALAYPQSSSSNPRIRQFRSWLADELKNDGVELG
ncbi:LysR substrate-binding domain-containing protein [Roseibium limicola]|uniref:LysR family transcriptional regulator n=1 Tax=Roseibium limicola TaxID=2816037 RepID=A0A939ERC9_9HYPH|nr:LysR substrate-binding domain-containing protein [Roseibium limicola]MBO0347264.1 LysR family transcriptional regulator [Roseibium limicola]